MDPSLAARSHRWHRLATTDTASTDDGRTSQAGARLGHGGDGRKRMGESRFRQQPVSPANLHRWVV